MIIRLRPRLRQRTPRETGRFTPLLRPSHPLFMRPGAPAAHPEPMFDERPPAPWDTPPAAPPPASPRRRNDGLALLLIGALIGGVVGTGGARAIVPALTGTPPAARATGTPAG